MIAFAGMTEKLPNIYYYSNAEYQMLIEEFIEWRPVDERSYWRNKVERMELAEGELVDVQPPTEEDEED